jgi:hypothetical protein
MSRWLFEPSHWTTVECSFDDDIEDGVAVLPTNLLEGTDYISLDLKDNSRIHRVKRLPDVSVSYIPSLCTNLRSIIGHRN